jgi:CHAD domain-containing protein
MTDSTIADMDVSSETRRFAAEQAQRQLGRLVFQISRTVKSRNPDAVHDLRVAIRTFTQTIHVFEACFPGKEMRKIRRRLKKIMIPSGEVRNCDVALKLLSKSHRGDAAELITKLHSRRAEFERVLTGLLKRWMERKTSLKWRAALNNEPATKAAIAFGGAAIAKTAQQTLRRMGKDYFARGNEASKASAPPEGLHRFRIATKKFRYTLELFAPLYGPPLGDGLASIKRTQSLLGDLNDCVTARELVSHYHGGDRLTSRLKKRQRKKAEEFHRLWNEEFGDAKRVRSWIEYLGSSDRGPEEAKKPVARSMSASNAQSRRPRVVA